jgi:Spy/CpxP family protein refolding chaperone
MSSSNLLERAQASRFWNPKVACVVTLCLVFLCGAVVGALAMDMGLHRRSSPFDSASGKAAYFEKLQQDLNLTPEQSAQMESILNDFWQYYRTVLSDGKQRIEQVLTPEQKARFEQRLQEQRR